MIQSLIDDAFELFGGMTAWEIIKEIVPTVICCLMMCGLAVLLL